MDFEHPVVASGRATRTTRVARFLNIANGTLARVRWPDHTEALSWLYSLLSVSSAAGCFRTVGKGGKERRIPVPGAFMRTLADYRLARQFDSADPLPDDPTPLIGSVRGDRYQKSR